MEDGLRLRALVESDLAELMSWFPDAASVDRWGGPFFRYPFDAASFDEDLRWRTMASRVLEGPGRELLGFGQFYVRHARMNLARLAVHPANRGRGHGLRLVRLLMAEAHADLGLEEFSLFVYRDNLPAIGCYRAAGFAEAPYPEGDPLADRAIYMTCPAAS